MSNELLSVKQLSERWQLTPHTLLSWRKKGTGPPFMKIGQKVYYKIFDVIEFEKTQKERAQK